VAKNNHNLAFHDHFHTLFLAVRITPFFAGVVVKPLYANYLRSEWLVSLPVK